MSGKLLINFTLFFAGIFCAGVSGGLAAEKTLVTINQFISHPALDSSEKGIEKALKDRGLIPDTINIRLDHAQGSIANAVQIAKHQASLNPAFMIAIATPAAQANFKAKTDKSTLAFVAVTDPAAAGLTSSANDVIGVSDQPPVEELLEVITEILPRMRTIGVIFNPGEVNSVNVIKDLEKAAMSRGIKVRKVVVSSSGNVKLALQKLIPDTDLVYLPQDNLVVSAIDTVVQVSLQAKIPVIANDPALVEKGLLLALGCDYFKSGVQLGHMIADMMEGKPVNPSIQTPTVKELRINQKTASELNINIPQELKTRARR